MAKTQIMSVFNFEGLLSTLLLFREGVRELYLIFQENLSKNNWSAEVFRFHHLSFILWDSKNQLMMDVNDGNVCRCTSRGRLWVAGGTWKSTRCSRLATQSGSSRAHKMTKKCNSMWHTDILYVLLSPTMFLFLKINISCLNIDNISPPNIRYIVKLRETVHVEEDPSRSCKNYPYKNFSIYRWVRDVRKNMNTHLAQRLRWQLPGPPLEGYSAWPNASTCESSSNILVKNCMKRRGVLDHLLKSNS